MNKLPCNLTQKTYDALKAFYALMPDPTQEPYTHAEWDTAWRALIKYTYFVDVSRLLYSRDLFHQVIGEHFFELNS